MAFSAVIILSCVNTGFAQSAGNARGIASVDIKYSSPERIINAIHDVYTTVGFEIVDSALDRMVFERAGSRKKDIAYGGLEGGVIEQVVIGLQEKSPTLFWLNCDVYMVKGRGGDPFFESREPVMRAFGGEYRKLLNKVKIMAEAVPANIIKK
jgi:hypothetical protein